ncbi:hypothetical protein Q5O24_09475 [Eubacteriaceae bacterium ES3]|nr:hypothetical protein Q5O24_09475 [Eubacteriaceae bacterium ES3]
MDIKNQMVKTSLVYAIISALLIGINCIYGLFGHGVHSPYMTYMFLYTLLGGSLFYIGLYKSLPSLIKSKAYRLLNNLYNSGIATLTVGSFLSGILEIAGTGSDYQKYFFIVGFSMVGLSVIVMSVAIIMQRNSQKQVEKVRSRDIVRDKS